MVYMVVQVLFSCFLSFRNWRSLFRAQEIMALLFSHWVPWSTTWHWKDQTL